MTKLTIWGRKTSSNVQKVLWCCDELGIPFDRIDIGGPFGGNDGPKYRALNPNGLIPTVEDGDFVLWESNTIIRYLSRKYGKYSLYSQDPKEAALIERWMDWHNGHVGPAMTPIFFGYIRTPPEKRDMAEIEAARKRASAQWEIVDGHLAKNKYMSGDGFSLGDIPLGIQAYRWFVLPIERPALRHLSAWYARLTERKPFKTHVMNPLA
ncbi:MAG TPA: glutathione S-transferase family protein [Alphaproteobacteria bacterium]|nr:glutathione S-transferase family protein [Alphaproteobacteria bacterium]